MNSARLWPTLLLLALVSATACATEWTETVARAASSIDPQTGQAVVVFAVELEYDPKPADSSLVFGWTVFESTPAGEIERSSFLRSTTLSGSPSGISLASERITVTAGRTYRAHVVADDEVNGLHYERDIHYTAPVSLPTGISLRGMDGTEAYDLTGVPDEELEELATLYDALQGNFTRAAEGIPLATFWSSHAASPDAFPALVVVAPFLGVNASIGPTSGPITLTVSRSIHLYPVPDSGAVAGLLEQLAVYDRVFVGIAFTGTATAATFDAGSVFVDDETWAVLAASADEEIRRASP